MIYQKVKRNAKDRCFKCQVSELDRDKAGNDAKVGGGGERESESGLRGNEKKSYGEARHARSSNA